jgi:uncharacterized membrane protein YeaQ/YmgE (transglycosylase-associated protein family)
MRATDPIVTFVLILVIGIVAGILFDRLAGPSWLARQFAGSTRGIITSALVGVAGAFVGYHIAVLLVLGGGLVTSVIAAAAGAALVCSLGGWLSNERRPPPWRAEHALCRSIQGRKELSVTDCQYGPSAATCRLPMSVAIDGPG